ncbi:Fluoroacetate dehalogenase [Roseovarius litorisediminis]|uniref:Fluoroacetate dehalogenase n=1 Tax=Roseovarius litorisediminis TaxID=1312363 RepID=A0A1Y5T2N3_9RHOB|nr:alpha/beta hydrolase [Roseovarius litorisediminis]SLN54603.1 Fluoroacetate dehalogenase [Roseovarius litorisediminis]
MTGLHPLLNGLRRLAFFFTTVIGTILMSQIAHAKDTILNHHSFGSGPENVLVLHSWIDNAGSFDNVKPYLDPDVYTYVFADLRGYGGSSTIKGEYTSSEAASDALNLADHLGWNRFHVIGHSQSGMIVQRMALNDWRSGSKRLKSMIAVTPVAADGYPADDDTKGFLTASIHNPEIAQQLAAGLTGGRLTARFAKAVASGNIATSNPDAMLGYYHIWVDEDFSDELATAHIETPTLVIAGRQDLPGFQADHYNDTIMKWLPNADLAVIEEAGHLPMYETPALLAALIEGHLSANSGP